MIQLDIEMPEYCYDCPLQHSENGRCKITGYSDCGGKRPFDCPLKEMTDSSKTDEANYQIGTTKDVNFVVTNNTDDSNYVSVTMPVECYELMATVNAIEYYIRLIDEAETTQSKERYHCIAEALYSRLTEMEERLIEESNNG